MSILERFTSLFAPDDCLNCGREGALLCRACLPALPSLKDRCFGCQTQIKGAGCPACMQSAGLTQLAATADYAGPAKLLVASLKFRGNQSAARLMAVRMAYYLPSDALLVHMPATTAHVRERGFDQSHLIARHLSRLSGLPYNDLLRRHGHQHQLGASRQERLRQLSAALSVPSPRQVAGKHVVLVDDVLTTGSSLTAAVAVLRQAGASRVDAVVFAQSLHMGK